MTDYGQTPDDALITLLRAGDADAEFALYDRYKRVVRARARAYFLIGGERDDLVQEGMIGLYKAVCEYAPDKEASFHSFANLCIKRQILTAIKGAARKKHTPLNRYVSLNRTAFSEADDERTLLDVFENLSVEGPEQAIISRESMDRMIDAIRARLSAFELRVLQYYLGGYSYQQIAEVVDRPAKAVDNALQRIKHKLDRIRREESAESR